MDARDGALWTCGDPAGSAPETVDSDGHQAVQRHLCGEAAGSAQCMEAIAHELVSRRITAYVSGSDRLGDDDANDLSQLLLGFPHVASAVQ